MAKTKNWKTKNSKKPIIVKKELKEDDVFCIVCRSIFLRPVTMPCDHTLCLECFKSMVNETSYKCPVCHSYISCWLRKFKQDWDSLVNENLWSAVQQQYPVEVQKKLNDEDDGLEERVVGQVITPIQYEKGEIKKEFDDMRMKFLREEEEMELQSVELAKQLEKEEAAERILNEKLVMEDMKIASAIQAKITEEFQQQSSSNESDKVLAKQLQKQVNSSKKGPLDKMFDILAKWTPKIFKTEYRDKQNSLSFCSSSSNTNIVSPSTSSSTCSENIKNTLIMDSFGTIENENLSICTCGRLQDDFSCEKPCQFCTAQMTQLNELSQLKTDFLMAKDLEKKIKMENFDNYNLRKRPASETHFSECNSIRKFPKLKQIHMDKYMKNSTNDKVD